VRTRPTSSLIGAKFVTVCNIAVRNHIHVYTHWKKYHQDPGLLCDFYGKMAVFTNCIHLPPFSFYKSFISQKLSFLCMFFHTTRGIFNGHKAVTSKWCVQQASSEWCTSVSAQSEEEKNTLMASHFLKCRLKVLFPVRLIRIGWSLWSTASLPTALSVYFLKSKFLLVHAYACISLVILPFMKRISSINKTNRSKVQLHPTIGSRSYTAHVENLLCEDLCCLQNDRVHSSINKLDGYLLCSLYFAECMR
jgi:hypothetical protein